jgi:hypothetical protein
MSLMIRETVLFDEQVHVSAILGTIDLEPRRVYR